MVPLAHRHRCLHDRPRMVLVFIPGTSQPYMAFNQTHIVKYAIHCHSTVVALSGSLAEPAI
jgi:hypothetical protein